MPYSWQLVGFDNTLSWIGVFEPSREKIWGLKPQQKYAIASCGQTVSSMLPTGEYKRAVW